MHEPTGLWATLTPEQRAKVLAHDGPEAFGAPDWLMVDDLAPIDGSAWAAAMLAAMARPRVIGGADYGSGPDYSAEVEGVVAADGTVTVTGMRVIRATFDGEAEEVSDAR